MEKPSWSECGEFSGGGLGGGVRKIEMHESGPEREEKMTDDFQVAEGGAEYMWIINGDRLWQNVRKGSARSDLYERKRQVDLFYWS